MPSNFTEMKIPVPFGYIAAKVWGSLNENSIRTIAMHGYMDNAGTWDRLIPLLPDQFYIVAIDLPGHGFSSHVPYGESECLILKQIPNSQQLFFQEPHTMTTHGLWR
jgi:pimeloyl-ACP methyl ester carboxylesterase